MMGAVKVVTRDGRAVSGAAQFTAGRLPGPLEIAGTGVTVGFPHDRERSCTRNGGKILRDHERQPGMRGRRASRGGCDHMRSAADNEGSSCWPLPAVTGQGLIAASMARQRHRLTIRDHPFPADYGPRYWGDAGKTGRFVLFAGLDR